MSEFPTSGGINTDTDVDAVLATTDLDMDIEIDVEGDLDVDVDPGIFSDPATLENDSQMIQKKKKSKKVRGGR